VKLTRGYGYAVLIGFLLAGSSVSRCAIVTLDSATKATTSDSRLLELKWVKSRGEQIGAYIQSKSLSPQSATIRILGLKDARYDVYVNWGGFAIKRIQEIAAFAKKPADTTAIEPGYVIPDKAAGDLATGIPIKIPGRIVPARLVRCVRSVGPRVRSACDGLNASPAGVPGRARNTLQQAADWVRSAVMIEETYRSAQLFVVPAGATPSEMDWRSRFTAKGTKEAVERACSMLQQARVRMSAELTDPVMREVVTEALTPVDVHVRYYMDKQVPRIRVEIRNDCDLSVSGAVNVEVPKGWKAQSKRPRFSGLASGGVYAETLQLIPASKRRAAPGKVSVTTTVTVAGQKGIAKLRIIRRCALSGIE